MLCAGLIPTGAMYDVIDAVTQFIPPPECHLGCMNWTAALNASERAASIAACAGTGGLARLLLATLGQASRCASPWGQRKTVCDA